MSVTSDALVSAQPKETKDNSPRRYKKRSPSNRWTAKLGKSWTPISDVFLRKASQLSLNPGHPGAGTITPTDQLIFIQLIAHKWDKRAPWPSTAILAERIGCSSRQIRNRLRLLEDAGYIRREERSGRTNLYHLEGLFEALEATIEEEPS